jgi:voltage-gated potassium channel
MFITISYGIPYFATMKSLRAKVYTTIAMASEKRGLGYAVDLTIMSLIVLSVLLVILESIPSLYARYFPIFHYLDLITVIAFMIEYVLRLWSIVEDPRYRHPVTGRLRWSVTPLALVDLISFLPSLLVFFTFDLRFIRIVRVIRLLRLLKFARYLTAFQTVGDVLVEKKEKLTVSFIFMIILLVFSATIMYYVEHNAQPDQFVSIPHTLWWSVATLTTVGYGDMTPITPLGKLLGGIIALIGIGMFALPAGIIASGFNEYARTQRKGEKKGKRETVYNYCPHCGKPLPH